MADLSPGFYGKGGLEFMSSSDLGGHRGLEGTLKKFLKGFFLISARQKIHFLNGRCDTCLTKEGIMPARMEVHVPSFARIMRI